MRGDDRAQGGSWRPSPPHVLRGLFDAVVVAALWLILAGTPTAQEAAVALLVGALTAGLAAVVRRQVGHRPSRFGRYLRLLPGAYLGAFRDSWRLGQALLRRPVGRTDQGRVRRVPFDVGGDDAEASGRRLAATLLVTLQPNTYLFGFDERDGVAVIHELVPDGDEPIPSSLCRSSSPGGPS